MPDKSDFVITALGEILWDVFPGGKRLGGAPANFAFYSAAFGLQSRIVSRIGADPAGDEIRDKVKASGLDPGFLQIDPVHPTGKVTVELDRQGIPSYSIHENTAWDFIEMTPELDDLAASSNAVCFGTLAQRSPVSRKTIRRFLDKVSANCLKVCDMNLRVPHENPDVIEYCLSACDVLKLNEDEAGHIRRLFGWKEAGWDLLYKIRDGFAIEYLAETRGDSGSRLLCPDKSAEHPGYSISLKDTVGAGDAFAAVLAVGILKKDSCDALNERANKTASLVCEQEGAWTKLPIKEIINEPF